MNSQKCCRVNSLTRRNSTWLILSYRKTKVNKLYNYNNVHKSQNKLQIKGRINAGRPHSVIAVKAGDTEAGSFVIAVDTVGMGQGRHCEPRRYQQHVANSLTDKFTADK